MEPEPLNARRMDMEDSDPSALGDSDSPVFEKFNPLLHGAVAATATASGSSGSEKRPELLCQAFLKRYMHYAKRIVHPQLCDEARAYIAGAYSELRSKQDSKTLPVTPRCLETIIRLSTAHAKARLSPTVEETDCQKAFDLMMFALYHETNVEGEDAVDTTNHVVVPNRRRQSDDDASAADSDEEPSSKRSKSSSSTTTATAVVDAATAAAQRKDAVMTLLGKYADRSGVDEISAADALAEVNKGITATASTTSGGSAKQAQFTQAELNEVLEALDTENKLMFVEGSVHII
eukprot:3620-Heterococcus_DN1.PRE.6